MEYLIDVFALILLYALGSAIAEVETYSAGVHVGSAILTSTICALAVWLLGGIFDIVPAWSEIPVTLLLFGAIAWLVASVIARVMYGATGSAANRMAAIVGIGQIGAIYLARWVLLAPIYAPVDVTL